MLSVVKYQHGRRLRKKKIAILLKKISQHHTGSLTQKMQYEHECRGKERPLYLLIYMSLCSFYSGFIFEGLTVVMIIHKAEN